jgi:hypothetical protein
MKNTINDLSILTPNGFKKFKGLRRLLKKCVKIGFNHSDISDIVVSLDHIFFVDNLPVKTDELSPGDMLTHKKYGNVKITSIQDIGEQYVYDPVDVDGDNTYYSGGLTSHNCSFIGSTATLIASEHLEKLSIQEPVTVKYNDLFKIYEEPKSNKKYILGVDVAEGVGGDYSVIQVLSINKDKQMEQVATYANNLIAPYDFAQICIGISDYYNNAEMLIENNNVGAVLIQTIWYDYDIDRIINTDTKKGRRELGIKATTRTKARGTTNLKRCVENGWLKIVDEVTINELGAFEEVRPGVYKCGSETGHDDHVMSLMWGCYFIETNHFEASGNETVKRIDEEYVLTAAVFDDDMDYHSNNSPIDPFGNLSGGDFGSSYSDFGDYGSFGSYGDFY